MPYNSNYGGQGYNNQLPATPPSNDATQQFVWAIKTCFNKYVEFNGRASRCEFWWWTLFSFLIGCVAAASPWIGGVLQVALLLPTLAVTWRRLHDTGRGGGWFFIGLIPLVGQIILIVWLAQPGEYHPNRFGPNPYGYDDGLPPTVH